VALLDCCNVEEVGWCAGAGVLTGWLGFADEMGVETAICGSLLEVAGSDFVDPDVPTATTTSTVCLEAV